jgi:hypothetical protein
MALQTNAGPKEIVLQILAYQYQIYLECSNTGKIEMAVIFETKTSQIWQMCGVFVLLARLAIN